MSKRSAKRATRVLKQRQRRHDDIRDPRGYKRPGSLNPHKTQATGKKR